MLSHGFGINIHVLLYDLQMASKDSVRLPIPGYRLRVSDSELLPRSLLAHDGYPYLLVGIQIVTDTNSHPLRVSFHPR